MKPVLKYPGSKWRIAGEIVARIPEHHTYLEPFFGSGAVFFSKEPSRIEMINDLDNNVPNLFRCIRDDPDRLARIVATTPYSRHEYERAFTSNEELLGVLKNSEAMVMISGYESELYDSMLKGWHKEQFRSNAEYGGNRVETVWMNYERQFTIKDFQQEKLF